jgi:hypothetical protein
VRRPLDIDISDLARVHIRAAEDWWRLNRTKAPNAIREELERAEDVSVSSLLQPERFRGLADARPENQPRRKKRSRAR